MGISFWRSLLCAVLLLAIAGPVWAGPAPNFVVVFTDDQTYRAIGYNNEDIHTPHLNALAEGGMIFNRAYVSTPICVSSRASMMSGLFPQQHGAIALNSSGFRQQFIIDKTMPTLAGILSAHGYDTGFCGKSHLGDPKEYGFEFGQNHRGLDDQEAFDFAQDFIAERANSSKPFFLWVAPHQPHVPLLPGQQWLDLYDADTIRLDENFREKPLKRSHFNQGVPGEHYYRDSKYTNNYKKLSAGPPRSKKHMQEFNKAYYATISHLDHQVGQLVQQLKEAGQYENTLLIFLSDNGYFLGNHGLGNKITMHEESVRVPFFVHGMGVKATGKRSNSLISSLDVFPTVLEMAGIERPAHLEGKSLLPLFSKPKKSLRTYVASECVGVSGESGTGHRMVRTNHWKYMLSGVNEEALFDHRTDPFELNNLINDKQYTKVRKRLRGYMREWMDEVGDTHQPPPTK